MATTSKTGAGKNATIKDSTKNNSDTKLVQELADILDKAGLAELEYETDTVAIRLSRVTAAVAASAPAIVAAPVNAVEPANAEPANPANHPGTVPSPMVGTVYTAPEPDAPMFIAEGDIVKVGQTLFIVEAMKVMNPITAPHAGKVTKIFVQNAQPIEFGQALVIIE